MAGLVANGFGPCRVHATTDQIAQQRDRPAGVDHALLSESGPAPESDLPVGSNKAPLRQPPELSADTALFWLISMPASLSMALAACPQRQAKHCVYAIIVAVTACQIGCGRTHANLDEQPHGSSSQGG